MFSNVCVCLTHLVLRPECSLRSRSKPWLLMTWRLGSPGHQQPWYWVCKRAIFFHKKVYKLPLVSQFGQMIQDANIFLCFSIYFISDVPFLRDIILGSNFEKPVYMYIVNGLVWNIAAIFLMGMKWLTHWALGDMAVLWNVMWTPRKLLGFCRTEEGFWPDFTDIKPDYTQKFYWSYSSFISKCVRTG